MGDPRPPGEPAAGILKVVLAYAAFAALWILLSDRAVEWLFEDAAAITLASTVKGWVFVAVTSLLLYGLMRRMDAGRAGPAASPAGLRPLLLPAGLLAVAILSLTAAGVVASFGHQRQMALARLETIAELKTRQVADWLGERRDDARFLQTADFFTEGYQRWHDGGDPASYELLEARLEEFRRSHALEGVLLLDARGAALGGARDRAIAVDPALRDAAREAAGDGRVRRLGPYRDAAGGLRLDFLVPLAAVGKPPPVVVLRVDPAAYLYPTLKSWPVPSASGEVVLFRREADQVLFINDLRHRRDAAVRLRLPVAAPRLLAAQVLRGEARLGSRAEGVDYREVPVMGVVRDIPGTDWFLVAKLDKAELYTEAVAGALWIALAGLLALFAAAASLLLFRQRRQLDATLRERGAREEKLRALQLLEAIADGSTDAIFAKDLQGRYLLFNKEAARVTGKRPAEVLGRDDTALFPPEQAAFLMEIGRRVMAEDRAMTAEEVLTTVDGTTVYLALKGPLHDASGKVVGLYGISRDITGRQRAEAALRESEERLRLALQAANQGLYDLNVQTGEAVVSPEYALMLGYEPAQFHETNAAWIERLHPDDHDSVAATYRDYVAGRIPEYRVEFRQRTHEGEWKWILSLGRIVERDAAGRPLRMMGTHTDITARKRAEEALRENEALTRAVLDHLPVGIAVNSVDPAVAFSYMNDNFPLFYRTTREKLADPDAFWEAVYEDPVFREEIRRRVLEDCASGDPRRMYWVDVPIARAGEETRYITARNTPVPGSRLMISTVWDVTEHKRAEEERGRLEAQLLQAQKMESVGRLAGGVAHDFNNMLLVIMGHAALALERLEPGQPARADLEEILHAAQRSAELTRQLLAFARRQTVTPKVLDLNRTVEGLLSMLRRLIGEDIDLAWRPGERLWPIRIDPAQIDQILVNLCVNARDAIAGVGKVTIETDNVSLDEGYCADHLGFAPGDYARLVVSDDGSGMSQEVLSHIFEPFFTTKGTGQGTGLGLATVYGIVKQNEGFINVYSEAGAGTTVRVYLPRCSAGTAEEPEARGGEPPPGGGETVLLVEDEASILNLGASMLRRLGYTVLTAGTAAEAIRLAGEYAEEIRLLVTDVVMPEMNGRELAQRLAAGRPGLNVLFMSGYTANVIAHQGVLDEGVHFIQKPFSARDLAFKVREALGGAGGGSRTDGPAPAGLRVLLVDDDEALLELVRRNLVRRGHRVAAYADPAAALEEFRRRPGEFDCVVTDLAMRGMAGFDLVRHAQAVRADVPIAIVSGYVTPQDEATARSLGVRAVILKPGTVDELGATLDRLLRSAARPPEA